ncbi:Uncharacterised protein [Pseudomonas fluorescens]|uniref:Uncharacterized protein n=1 Tax=Pseudomonas fluorescens TaxID=294 RepID=A0A379IGE5_PSEFL|nr:hypothetical protein [Pseudomonas fluorescens]SUD31806.1 Uncharacterised protein [Pseudomonas fluorescens]
MSFFQNTKVFFSSSAKVLGHASEILAEFSVAAERSASILSVRAAIINLEFYIDRPEIHSPSVVEEKKKALLARYDELLALSGENNEPEVMAKKQALISIERVAAASAARAFVRKLESQIDQAVFKLPIDEIRKKQQLQRGYESLISFLDKDFAPEISEVLDKNKQLIRGIGLLEAQRRTTRSELYSCGNKKIFINMLDGGRDGSCECWYENGALKFQGDFKGDLLHGRYRFWYADGSLGVDASYIGGYLACPSSFFMKNGIEVVKFSRVGDSMRIDCTLWNGLHLGGVSFASGNIRGKFTFVLRVIFNLKVMLSFYRARKGGADHCCYVEFMGLLGGLSNNQFGVPVELK